MRKQYGIVAALLGLCLLALPPMQLLAGPQQGVHYHLVSDPRPPEDAGAIVVEDFFFYGCPSCYQLKPYLDRWQESKPEDVELVHAPSALNPSWEPFARAYYAARLLEVDPASHGALFEALHVHNFRPGSERDLADFYAEYGADPEEFLAMYNSFAVETAVNRVNSRARQFGVSGVPTLVVNGSYRIEVADAGGHAGMIDVLDAVIEKIRVER